MNLSIFILGGADSKKFARHININNSAGVTLGEPTTTNLHGIQASSLYCSYLFNNISGTATIASVTCNTTC